MERTEEKLGNTLMSELYRRLGEPTMSRDSGSSGRFNLKNGRGICEAEGGLEYTLPDGTQINHRWDVLIHVTGGKKMAVELKFLSSVTDQFKARAYDAAHTKKKYGDSVYCVLGYLRFQTGLSIKAAKSYCYSFDEFIGVELNRPEDVIASLGKLADALEGIVDKLGSPRVTTTSA